MIKLNRKKEYNDKVREYEVILDNNYIGNIYAGETKNFEVTAGNHTIYLKIDWCRSNILDFHVSDNEVFKFECGNSINGWKRLFHVIYIIFLRNKYLWIKIKPTSSS